MFINWFSNLFTLSEGGDEEYVDDEDMDQDIFAIDYEVAYCSNGRPLRMLCLHGRGSNNDITGIQMMSLGLERFVEIDTLCGKMHYEPASKIFRKLSTRSFRIWWNDAETFQKAIIRVLTIIKKYGPYDGLYGFSMGAALVTALSTPGISKVFNHRITWRFVVCAHGVDLENEKLAQLLQLKETVALPQIHLPSLHIIGRRDPYRLSSHQLLNTRYDEQNSCVVFNNCAHELPTTLRQESQFIAQVHEFFRNAAST
mmetsp:Transcript_6806/g.9526  ORF Transcript_6806/g.9526 Transcript_6806/m.9526 type:complete len:256 (-) Transcript_6806:106-873(-)